MSTTIDNKVVEMRFDNRHFESNVATTMSSLDKLKQKLNLSGATKGLVEVDNAAKKVDMAGLGNAVETVRMKFSALEVMGVTALTNITNSAINAGKRLASSLTVDQVTAGWSKYEQKTSSVQTIMNATGKSIEDVNGYLERLMWFSDETSYGFTDMTAALGQMTSSGGDIENLIPLITGVANATAYAGKGASEFSRVMYNLNQSYGAGYLQLMDWKSVELAGVGSKQLKETFIEVGEQLGKIKKGQVTVANFAETLKDKWADTEVMEMAFGRFGVFSDAVYDMVASGDVDTAAQAIEKLSGQYGELGEKAFKSAQEAKSFTEAIDATKDAVSSGWLASFEIIFGDYEEAKVMWTELANTLWDIFASGAEARNELLAGWKELGGRTDLIDSVKNAFHGLSSVVAPIKEAFREIFPPITVEQLVGFTKGLKELTAKFKLSDTTSENLKRTFKGLFAVLDIGRQAFMAIFKAVGSLFGSVGELGGGILDITARFGDWLVKLNESIKKGDIFNKVFQGIAKVIKLVIVGVTKVTEWVGNNLVFPGLEGLYALFGKIYGRITQVTDAVGDMGLSLGNSGFFKALQMLWGGIVKIGSGLISGLGKVLGGLFDKLASGDLQGIIDFINGIIGGGIGVALIRFFNSLSAPFEGFGDIIENLGDCLEGLQMKLKADALMKIAGAIAILAASLLLLSLADSDKLTTALGAMTLMFTGLVASLEIMTKRSSSIKGGITSILDGFQAKLKADALMKTAGAILMISVAVLILSVALKSIAELKWGDLAKGLLGIAGLVAIMVAAVKILGSGGQTAIKGATQMILFAFAIQILTSACRDIATLSWEELAKGLIGVGALMAAVVLFLKTAKFDSKAFGTALGIVVLAAAIKILASACGDFATMSWSEIGKGLAAIAVLLAEIAIFTKLTGNATKVLSTGIAMIAIAAAMKIFASAMQDMGSMSWESIAKGLVAMAGALILIVVALNFMPKNMLTIGVGLLAVSAALVILASALDKMGNMSWESIAKGLVALGGSIAILAIGLNLMSGAIAGSAALLIAAAAIAVLTPSLLLLGAMSWESILKGLVSIAGAFIIMGVAGLVLQPLIPAILGLAAAMALLGIGILAAGVGLLAFGAGLTALATGFVAITASLGAVVTGIQGLMVAIAIGIANGLIAFSQVIISGVPIIGEAIKVLILTLCDIIIQCAPKIIECVGVLLEELLAFLVEYIPKIVDAGIELIIGLLEGIASKIDDIIEAAVDVIEAFIRGIGEGSIDIINAAVDTMITFIEGLAQGIRDNTDRMIAAVDELMDAIMYAIEAWFSESKDKGSELLDKVKEGIKSKIEDLKQAGKDAIQGFINGIKEKIEAVGDAASEVGKKALNSIKSFLGIESPSKEFAAVGRFSGEGMVKGLKSYSGKVATAAKKVGSVALNTMKDAVSGIADAFNNNVDGQPTIRPVLDLSDVESGAGRISSLLDAGATYGVLTNVGSISSMMNHRNQNGTNDDIISELRSLKDNLGNTTYNLNGITYDDGSNIAEAVKSIARAAKIERRT